MKITTSPPMTNTPATLFKNMGQTDFNTLLDSTGDEYYRQHQNQLQQSALTFKSSVAVKELSPKTTAEQLNQPNQRLPASQLNLSAQLIRHSIVANVEKPQESCIPTEADFNELITNIEIFSNQQADTLSAKISERPQLKSNLTAIRNTSVPDTPFKNHHLHITENAVELTLNTSQFSGKQAKEIQTLIKQWLQNKGYRLQQLIINGVQQ